MSSKSYRFLVKSFTSCVTKDARNMPVAAMRPPQKVVIWMPNLSMRIPATGDRKNVVPIVNEPTDAEKMRLKCKEMKIKFHTLQVFAMQLFIFSFQMKYARK